MKYAKFLVVGVAGLLASAGAMALGGCGSSSSNSNGNDSGTDDATTQDDTSTGPMCSPVTGMMCPAAMGLTCCIDPTNIAGLLSGAPCVAAASCTTTLQYECLQTSDCMSGQVCCAAVAGDAGILEAGLGDAAVGDGGIGSLLEGGAGGIMGLLSAINVHVSCAASCSGMQMQLCGSNADCKTPDTCQATALPGAGALGGGGGDAGGGLTSMFPMAIMPKACTPPVSEGGAPEGGSDAGDGGTPGYASDGGTTPADGGSDGPTE
jgi:hypothetical protein